MAYPFPDGVLLLGARTWTSFLGIVLIVIGQWHADRIWDDTVFVEGPPESDKPTSTTQDIAATATEVMDSAYEYLDSAYKAITDPEGAEIKRVSQLLTGPSGFSLMVAVFGWMLLAFSFLLECHMLPNTWHVSFLTLTMFLATLLMAMTQTILLPLAIRSRKVHEHVHFFTVASFCGYVLLGVLLVIDRNEAPFWLPLVGSAAIATAPNLLWFCRKRGDTYDRVALLTPRPVMYNVGGPLLVSGWLMFWVAMNYIAEENPDRRHLPVFWTSRTAVAFEGAIAIFGAYWATGYAHDEHDDSDQIAALETLGRVENVHRSPRPLKAFVFGRILETRLFFVVAWFMISVSVFLPMFLPGSRFWKILLFLALFAQGFAIGVQHVLGIRACDDTKYQKWSRVVESFYILIVLLVFISSGFAAGMLTLFGVLLLGGGWKLLQMDRKRGEYWIETGAINPKWTVYSYGVLLFPLGLLLFAWGLSIP